MKFGKLKVGEVLSEQQFYKVEKLAGMKVQLRNDNGENIVVDNLYVERCLQSAVQFDEEKTLTKTEVAAQFIAHSGVAITVNFNKQVKEADVVKEIMTAYESSTPKEIEKAVKKAVNRGMVGEERTMTGRHYGSINEFGRVHFIDMEEEKAPGKDYDSRIRQVDPRGINWFIGRGVKYNVK